MGNAYEKKRDFTAKVKLKGGRKFRRVFEEGYMKDDHAIGINEIYIKPKKDLDTSIKYSVTDTKNPKNYKEFNFGKRKEAQMYAEELKDSYEKER